ncbi:uncharacterized protein LOC143577543 [Bidens hawaiensis]|uniref:uncharacterized protein LOC143577543 n=1 Tax=Bidens hawaiensis TaxID=980011 RepID=UPI004049230C
MENHLAFSNLNLTSLIKGVLGMGDKTRFWIDLWLTPVPLREVFPNLFLIVKDKVCLTQSCFEVVDGNIVWKWRWKRSSLNQNETNELSVSLNMLQLVIVNNTPDRWIWDNDLAGVFTVASMKQILLKNSNMPVPFTIKWNSWVPIKVNILAWKAEMDRLPTYVALVKRNVDVGSTCRLCGDYEETCDHLLTSCYFAMLIWQFVSNWCNIPPIFAFSVRDLLTFHEYCNLGLKKNKVLYGVILTACWCIWKTRNEMIFQNKTANISKTMKDIKSILL